MKNSSLHMLAMMLVVVGALNWGLVGLLDFNLVMAILGGYPMLEKLVYVLVGVSGLIITMSHKDDCMMCKDMMMDGAAMKPMKAAKAKPRTAAKKRRK